MPIKFSTIYHAFRKHHNLTCNEYVICDMISFTSKSIYDNPTPGWCSLSRESLANEMGLSKQAIIKLVEKMILQGLIERHSQKKYLRPTRIWENSYKSDDSKESLPNKPVKKVYQNGKESLPNDGKESLPNDGKESLPNKEYNTIPVNNKIKKKDFLSANADSPSSSGIGFSEQPNTQNPPLSAAPSLYTKFIDEYYQWFIGMNDGVPPKINSAAGLSAKNLISYFTTVAKTKAKANETVYTDTEMEGKILECWTYVLCNWKEIDPFLQDKTRLIDIDSNIQNILKILKSGAKKQTQTTGGAKPGHKLTSQSLNEAVDSFYKKR